MKGKQIKRHLLIIDEQIRVHQHNIVRTLHQLQTELTSANDAYRGGLLSLNQYVEIVRSANLCIGEYMGKIEDERRFRTHVQEWQVMDEEE